VSTTYDNDFTVFNSCKSATSGFSFDAPALIKASLRDTCSGKASCAYGPGGGNVTFTNGAASYALATATTSADITKSVLGFSANFTCSGTSSTVTGWININGLAGSATYSQFNYFSGTPVIGASVSGPCIPSGTTIKEVSSTTSQMGYQTITLSTPVTATSVGVLSLPYANPVCGSQAAPISITISGAGLATKGYASYSTSTYRANATTYTSSFLRAVALESVPRAVAYGYAINRVSVPTVPQPTLFYGTGDSLYSTDADTKLHGLYGMRWLAESQSPFFTLGDSYGPYYAKGLDPATTTGQGHDYGTQSMCYASGPSTGTLQHLVSVVPTSSNSIRYWGDTVSSSYTLGVTSSGSQTVNERMNNPAIYDAASTSSGVCAPTSQYGISQYEGSTCSRGYSSSFSISSYGADSSSSLSGTATAGKTLGGCAAYMQSELAGQNGNAVFWTDFGSTAAIRRGMYATSWGTNENIWNTPITNLNANYVDNALLALAFSSTGLSTVSATSSTSLFAVSATRIFYSINPLDTPATNVVWHLLQALGGYKTTVFQLGAQVTGAWGEANLCTSTSCTATPGVDVKYEYRGISLPPRHHANCQKPYITNSQTASRSASYSSSITPTVTGSLSVTGTLSVTPSVTFTTSTTYTSSVTQSMSTTVSNSPTTSTSATVSVTVTTSPSATPSLIPIPYSYDSGNVVLSRVERLTADFSSSPCGLSQYSNNAVNLHNGVNTGVGSTSTCTNPSELARVWIDEINWNVANGCWTTSCQTTTDLYTALDTPTTAYTATRVQSMHFPHRWTSIDVYRLVLPFDVSDTIGLGQLSISADRCAVSIAGLDMPYYDGTDAHKNFASTNYASVTPTDTACEGKASTSFSGSITEKTNTITDIAGRIPGVSSTTYITRANPCPVGAIVSGPGLPYGTYVTKVMGPATTSYCPSDSNTGSASSGSTGGTNCYTITLSNAAITSTLTYNCVQCFTCTSPVVNFRGSYDATSPSTLKAQTGDMPFINMPSATINGEAPQFTYYINGPSVYPGTRVVAAGGYTAAVTSTNTPGYASLTLDAAETRVTVAQGTTPYTFAVSDTTLGSTKFVYFGGDLPSGLASGNTFYVGKKKGGATLSTAYQSPLTVGSRQQSADSTFTASTAGVFSGVNTFAANDIIFFTSSSDTTNLPISSTTTSSIVNALTAVTSSYTKTTARYYRVYTATTYTFTICAYVKDTACTSAMTFTSAITSVTVPSWFSFTGSDCTVAPTSAVALTVYHSDLRFGGAGTVNTNMGNFSSYVTGSGLYTTRYPFAASCAVQYKNYGNLATRQNVNTSSITCNPSGECTTGYWVGPNFAFIPSPYNYSSSRDGLTCSSASACASMATSVGQALYQPNTYADAVDVNKFSTSTMLIRTVTESGTSSSSILSIHKTVNRDTHESGVFSSNMWENDNVQFYDYIEPEASVASASCWEGVTDVITPVSTNVLKSKGVPILGNTDYYSGFSAQGVYIPYSSSGIEGNDQKDNNTYATFQASTASPIVITVTPASGYAGTFSLPSKTISSVEFSSTYVVASTPNVSSSACLCVGAYVAPTSTAADVSSLVPVGTTTSYSALYLNPAVYNSKLVKGQPFTFDGVFTNSIYGATGTVTVGGSHYFTYTTVSCAQCSSLASGSTFTLSQITASLSTATNFGALFTSSTVLTVVSVGVGSIYFRPSTVGNTLSFTGLKFSSVGSTFTITVGNNDGVGAVSFNPSKFSTLSQVVSSTYYIAAVPGDVVDGATLNDGQYLWSTSSLGSATCTSSTCTTFSDFRYLNTANTCTVSSSTVCLKVKPSWRTSYISAITQTLNPTLYNYTLTVDPVVNPGFSSQISPNWWNMVGSSFDKTLTVSGACTVLPSNNPGSCFLKNTLYEIVTSSVAASASSAYDPLSTITNTVKGTDKDVVIGSTFFTPGTAGDGSGGSVSGSPNKDGSTTFFWLPPSGFAPYAFNTKFGCTDTASTSETVNTKSLRSTCQFPVTITTSSLTCTGVSSSFFAASSCGCTNSNKDGCEAQVYGYLRRGLGAAIIGTGLSTSHTLPLGGSSFTGYITNTVLTLSGAYPMAFLNLGSAITYGTTTVYVVAAYTSSSYRVCDQVYGSATCTASDATSTTFTIAGIRASSCSSISFSAATTTVQSVSITSYTSSVTLGAGYYVQTQAPISLPPGTKLTYTPTSTGGVSSSSTVTGMFILCHFTASSVTAMCHAPQGFFIPSNTIAYTSTSYLASGTTFQSSCSSTSSTSAECVFSSPSLISGSAVSVFLAPTSWSTSQPLSSSFIVSVGIKETAAVASTSFFMVPSYLTSGFNDYVGYVGNMGLGTSIVSKTSSTGYVVSDFVAGAKSSLKFTATFTPAATTSVSGIANAFTFTQSSCTTLLLVGTVLSGTSVESGTTILSASGPTVSTCTYTLSIYYPSSTTFTSVTASSQSATVTLGGISTLLFTEIPANMPVTLVNQASTSANPWCSKGIMFVSSPPALSSTTYLSSSANTAVSYTLVPTISSTYAGSNRFGSCGAGVFDFYVGSVSLTTPGTNEFAGPVYGSIATGGAGFYPTTTSTTSGLQGSTSWASGFTALASSSDTLYALNGQN